MEQNYDDKIKEVKSSLNKLESKKNKNKSFNKKREGSSLNTKRSIIGNSWNR